MENSGEFCATSGKNCNKQSILVRHSNICKTAVDWVTWISDMVRVRCWPIILPELMWNDPWWRSLLHLLFVAITYGKVSLWLRKSLENSQNFFLLLCGHPDVLFAEIAFKGVYSSYWTHYRTTGRHLSYGITQCYLPPDTSERTLSSPQPNRPVLDVPTPEGWKAELA